MATNAITVIPATMATNTDAATVTKNDSAVIAAAIASMEAGTMAPKDAAAVIAATMATMDNAAITATMEGMFRRLQSLYVAILRCGVFSRTTWLLGFVGVLLISATLLKIPPVDDGSLPLLLKPEMLIFFAVGGAFGMLLNLFVFLMLLLLCINEGKLNKIQPPSQELRKGIDTQNNLMRAIRVADKCCFLFGSSFWVYVFVVALFATFVPNGVLRSFGV